MKKKIHRETIERIIDYGTGEVKEDLATTVQYVEGEPEYVKLYLGDIMRLQNIPKSANALLFELLRLSTYTNEITIVKHTRDKICRQLGIADITFRKAVETFVDKGILTKIAKNVYAGNPYLFGRGKWDSIKRIRLLVEYNEHGRFLIKQDEIEQPQLFPNEQPVKISGIRFMDKFESHEVIISDKVKITGHNRPPVPPLKHE